MRVVEKLVLRTSTSTHEPVNMMEKRMIKFIPNEASPAVLEMTVIAIESAPEKASGAVGVIKGTNISRMTMKAVL